jgi:hypothetical protein
MILNEGVLKISELMECSIMGAIKSDLSSLSTDFAEMDLDKILDYGRIYHT